MRIDVVNRPGKGHNGAEYIGRGGRGLAGSPLANPRRLGDPRPDGGVWRRGETISLFEQDLRRVLDETQAEASWWDGRRGGYRALSGAERRRIVEEMRRLLARARSGPLALDCFCSPLPCHGEAIQRLLEEMNARA